VSCIGANAALNVGQPTLERGGLFRHDGLSEQ